MCTICGCSSTAPQHDQGHTHDHHHGHGQHHGHSHDHDHGREHRHVAVDGATGDLHYGAGPASVTVPGMSQERAIRIEQDVLGANNRHATANRAHFASHGVLALNLVSSPGSGKTTLLCKTIEALRERDPALMVAVIEGDQQTSNDADRIRATGAPAIQVNTGKGCHLDARMVADAFTRLPLHHHHDHEGHHHHDHDHDHVDDAGSILFIENVGNLVCPAMWDLGEAAKVAILSVTEGEDKPLKYPDMFAAASVMVLNKVDLLPYLDFDVAQCIAYARRVNPAIEVLQVSATTGQGIAEWLDWIAAHRDAPERDAVAMRIARLEKELADLKARSK